jgi:hypothetical protein
MNSSFDYIHHFLLYEKFNGQSMVVKRYSQHHSSMPLNSYIVKSENFLLTLINEFCHSREGGNPEKFWQRKSWIPASAGMTKK